MTKTSIEIIVLHEDGVNARDIATRLYFAAKRSAARCKVADFSVDSYRLGPAVSAPVPQLFSLPMPSPYDLAGVRKAARRVKGKK